MTRRHLITGAQGLIGRHLAAHILAVDPTALVLGIGRSPRADAFFTHAITARGAVCRARVPHTLLQYLCSERYRYESLPLQDIGSVRGIVAQFRPDYVFHLASALHSAPASQLAATNVDGTASLLQALEGIDTRIVLGSSAAVYGRPQRLPIDETHPCVPVNEYGVSKLAAERIALREMDDVVVARIFNVVGPGQSEDHVCGRLAAQLAWARHGKRERFTTGPLAPTRDFIDVRDVARACVLAITNDAADGRTLNVGTGIPTSIRDVARMIADGLGKSIEPEVANKYRAGDIRHCYADTRLAEELLGFRAEIPFELGMEDLLAWLEGREASDSVDAARDALVARGLAR
jgi:nucleoside-diphosphate-sugar epimerase